MDKRSHTTFRWVLLLVLSVGWGSVAIAQQKNLGDAESSGFSEDWIGELPPRIQQSILWTADYEDNSLNDWEFSNFQYPGGGVFNTGQSDEAIAETTLHPHSGYFAASATIKNAYAGQNGSKAVRLMRWTDRPWDESGDYFPPAAYYSTWMYFPYNYNPNKSQSETSDDSGWWNVFQFKSNDINGISQLMWALNVDFNSGRNQMEFYLSSKFNTPRTITQSNPVAIPTGRWVHVEAFYRVSALDEGRITIYQDGNRILDAINVRTAMNILDEHAIWGIGSQTDHIEGGPVPGEATLYFDDAVISTRRVSTTFKFGRKK